MREGYAFDGWYEDAKLTTPFDWSKERTENAVAYAKWTPQAVTLSFETDGGTEIAAQTLDYNSVGKQPANPVKDGYTFEGWYADSALTTEFDFSKALTADAVAYAKWSKDTVYYTVTFTNGYPGEERAVLGTQSVVEGGAAMAPEAPTREGYTFKEWDNDFSNVTSDITVNATWEKDDNSDDQQQDTYYTVTFTTGYGEKEVLGTQTVKSGEGAMEPAAPSREGYTFAGWDAAFNKVEADITVNATWEPEKDDGGTDDGSGESTKPTTYLVTFKDGQGNVIETQTIEEGQAATAPSTTPSMDGYEFVGWDVDFSSVTNDLTVSPVWKKVEDPTDDGKQDEEPEAISYANTEGNGTSWTQGSSDPASFTFKRSVDDSTTYSHFVGVQVDGQTIDPANYTAVSGSVIVSLKPEYLNTLSVGEHTITAIFDDGNNPSATFTILAKPVQPQQQQQSGGGITSGTGAAAPAATATAAKTTAKTADEYPVGLVVLLLLAGSGACVARKKSKTLG